MEAEKTSAVTPASPRADAMRGKFARLFGCFALVFVATVFGGAVDRGLIICLANGVLLAYILLVPRRTWPQYLAAGILAHIAAAPLLHYRGVEFITYISHDTFEVLIAALLLRRRSAELPNFTDIFYLLRFTVCAVVIAPLCTALASAIVGDIDTGQPFLATFGIGFASDSLGFLVATPACVAMFRARLRDSSQHHWLQIIPVLAVIFVLMGQSRIPASPILFPLLVFVLLRMGLGWASLCSLTVTIVSAWFISRGLGPFSSASSDPLPAGIQVQILTISLMAVLYSVSVVIENLRNSDRRLQQIASLHALVAENSRDVILLIDFNGSRQFISSPERFWGGWSRKEIQASNSLDLIHPDDRATIAEVLDELRISKDGALIETRLRRRDSSYGWIEASLRTVRDPISHLPTGVLASVREITQRKHAEQQLEDAFHAVEALSVTDPLTGLSNRRRFDQTLASEWRRALREQNPISLLLIDADHFKRYNDTYGHPSGDTCLKQIADAVRCGATRASDLAARIGGEEFVVLLANTTASGACGLATRICEDLRARALPHSATRYGFVTVSIGCATVVPQPGQNFSLLVDLADQALYAAKHAGRNCIHPPAVAEQTNLFRAAEEEPTRP